MAVGAPTGRRRSRRSGSSPAASGVRGDGSAGGATLAGAGSARRSPGAGPSPARGGSRGIDAGRLGARRGHARAGLRREGLEVVGHGHHDRLDLALQVAVVGDREGARLRAVGPRAGVEVARALAARRHEPALPAELVGDLATRPRQLPAVEVAQAAARARDAMGHDLDRAVGGGVAGAGARLDRAVHAGEGHPDPRAGGLVEDDLVAHALARGARLGGQPAPLGWPLSTPSCRRAGPALERPDGRERPRADHAVGHRVQVAAPDQVVLDGADVRLAEPLVVRRRVDRSRVRPGPPRGSPGRGGRRGPRLGRFERLLA